MTKLALFLKTKHLGDSVILTSAINALPEDYQVDIVCFRESVDLFRMHPRVRHVFEVPRRQQGLSKFTAYWQMIKQLRMSQYQMLAQFSDDWRGAYLSRLLNAEKRVARQPKKRPKIWLNSFDVIAKVAQTRRHAAEQDVDLLRRVQLFNLPVAPAYSLEVPPDVDASVSQWLTEKLASQPQTDPHPPLPTKPLIVLHAAARWKFKGLPNSTWAQLIDALHARGANVVLSGAPSDQDMNVDIAKMCQHAPVIVDSFNLTSTTALIKQADVLISIDSMSVHIASAVKTPVVALFGPTDEVVWGPWQVPHHVIALNQTDGASYSCRPCGLDGCAGSKVSQCLVALPAERILQAALDLMHTQRASAA